MSERKNIIVPPEVSKMLQDILRSGKDAEVSCNKDGIVIREVEKKNKIIVVSGRR